MKKMVLIPYEEYVQRIKHQNRNIANINQNSIDEKCVAPQAISYCDTSPENIIQQDTSYEPQNEDKHYPLSRELILQPFGKAQKRNAETILSYIHNNMSWNGSGEIIVNSVTIPGSHVTDLIKDCLFNYKNFNPVGCEEFYHSLTDIPTSLIRNIKRREMIGLGRSGIKSEDLKNKAVIPPPPGIPVNKKPIDITVDMENSWISLWKAR